MRSHLLSHFKLEILVTEGSEFRSQVSTEIMKTGGRDRDREAPIA